MKKRISVLLLVLFVLSHISLRADEGMWLPVLVNKYNLGTMQGLGMKLTAEQIYSVNNSCLKDAVVVLDYRSCTGEIISPKGLLLTNHHCGYGEIQFHSSVEHDYLTHGFWASSHTEELPNEDKSASFLIRMEDVTDKVRAVLNDDMSESERNKAIEKISKELSEKATEGTHYEGSVESFFKSNYFYLFVYETFKDIRLVGAPPEAIGKFGHDTDNWMYPRHTGDFALFRVYCGPDGKPAKYSQDNVPYKPKHHLPISLKGIKKNDFAMVMGYPGTTNRYMTSWGVQQTIDHENTIRVKVRTAKLAILKEAMNSDEAIRIQYASKYSRSSNYWKYSIGQNKGLKQLDVVERKQDLEKEFTQWVNEDEQRQAEYGKALSLIEEAYKEMETYDLVQNYWFECLYGGPEVPKFSLESYSLLQTLKESPDNTDKVNQATETLREAGDKFFKDYHAPTDQKVMAKLFEIYAENVPKSYYPPVFKTLEEQFDGSFETFTQTLSNTSIFTNKERFESFLNEPVHEVFADENDFMAMTPAALDLYDYLLNRPDDETGIEIRANKLKRKSKDYFGDDYDKDQAKNDFIESVQKFYKGTNKDQQPYSDLIASKDQSFNEFADDIFSKSIFANPKKMKKFTKKPKLSKIENDIGFLFMKTMVESKKADRLSNDLALQVAFSTLQIYWDIKDKVEPIQLKLDRGERLFVKGLMEMNADSSYYPDANSTMRLTYGTVSDYFPRDAVRYKHYTTLSGVMEKEDPDNDEFNVPKRLKELYAQKDYGPYGMSEGIMPVCFITNNDITGGNSGSPVINAEGQLIGIAFDGNWEAMSGDIIFEPELQKTICVDIRYVLFIIDKYADAKHLIDEMTIIK